MMARKKARASFTRRLHRNFGAIAAAFVVFLVLSGLAINHANLLALDRYHVTQSALLNWYGLDKPESIKSYKLGESWISFAGSQVYLDEKLVTSISAAVGAVYSDDILVAAGHDEILLLDGSGQLIERQAWSPADASHIEAIGLMPNGAVGLKSGDGFWFSDTNLIQWQENEDLSIQPAWSEPGQPPASLLQTITQSYQGDGLNVERLLLDLHSGRFFGPVGVFVYDLLAVTIGFLAVSGLLLWSRGRWNRKKNMAKSKDRQ